MQTTTSDAACQERKACPSRLLKAKIRYEEGCVRGVSRDEALSLRGLVALLKPRRLRSSRLLRVLATGQRLTTKGSSRRGPLCSSRLSRLPRPEPLRLHSAPRSESLSNSRIPRYTSGKWLTGLLSGPSILPRFGTAVGTLSRPSSGEVAGEATGEVEAHEAQVDLSATGESIRRPCLPARACILALVLPPER